MIQWIKYDPENPPAERIMWLVQHMGGITSAKYRNALWQAYNGNYLMNVTHYAHINLPGEDKADEEE